MRFIRFSGITANIAAVAAFTAAWALVSCTPSVRYTRERPSYSSDGAPPPPALSSTQPPETLPQSTLEVSSSNVPKDRLIEVAESYLGTPYRYGGMSRKALDCSGFTGLVYREVYGVNLPRSSGKMWKKGRAVPLNVARAGDLCFFRMGGKSGRIDHVGIYMGSNRFIHASTSGGVMYSDLNDSYLSKRFAGIRRIL